MVTFKYWYDPFNRIRKWEYRLYVDGSPLMRWYTGPDGLPPSRYNVGGYALTKRAAIRKATRKASKEKHRLDMIKALRDNKESAKEVAV